MDKLVEREATARNPLATAPAIAVQFFLIPLLVVGATVLVYVGFRSLLTEDRSAEEYLTDIRSGGTNRRWPAAYELSRMMSDPEFTKKEQAVLAPELTKAFANSRDDDPRVRQYLALALGRLQPPIPPEAQTLAGGGAERQGKPDTDQRHLGARIHGRRDGGAGHRADVRVGGRGRAEDGGLRAGLAARRRGHRDTLTKALEDEQPDVQWNAAVALARHGRHEGVPVLRRMLDRDYVQRTVTRQQQAQDEIDPVGEVMISGLRAVAALKESTLSEPVKALSQNDTDLKVRQAALETLKAVG